MIAGQLEIQMMANLARLSNDMNQAKGMVGGAMKNIESAVASAKSALGALGVGFGVGYFASLIKSATDFADEMGKAAQKTGTTTEALSGLKYAGDLANVSFESLQKGMEKLAKNADLAIGGSKEVVDAFKRIKLDSAQFKDTGDLFTAVAEKLSKLPDGAQKTALAMELLGKSGAELIPLMNGGAAGIKAAADEAARFGQIVTGESARAAETFNDNMKRLEAASHGVTLQLVNQMTPALADISNAMIEAAKQGGVLNGVWVAMGGVMAHILGMDTASQARARLEEVNKTIATAQKQMASGSMNPEGAGSNWLNFLIPDVKLNPEAKAVLQKNLQNLVSERDRLLTELNPAPLPKMPTGSAPPILPAFGGKIGIAANPWADSMRDLAAYIKKLEEAAAPQQSQTEKLQAELETFRGLNGELPKYLQYLNDVVSLNEQDAAYLQKQLDAEDQSIALDKETQALRDQAVALRESAMPLEEFSRKWQEILALRDKFPQIIDGQALAAIAKKLSSEFGKAANDITEFWRQAAHNMQDAMSSFLFDAMQGKLDNLESNFKAMLDHMVANAMAANLSKYLFGDFTGGGDLGGVVGGLVGNISGGGGGSSNTAFAGGINLPSFDVGTPFVPQDMVAKIHKGERITPASQNNAGSNGRSIVQHVTFNVQGQITSGTQKQILLGSIGKQ